MMKTLNKIFLIVCFLIIIIIPFLLFFIIKTERVIISEHEKRVLAEKPTLDLNNIDNYGTKYEEYFNDHFPFREDLVLANKNVKYEGFDYVEGDVLVGKDEWMFYNPSLLESTLSDYQGTNLYTDEELKNTIDILNLSNDVLSKNKIDFYMMFIPNKNRVYSEFFPSKYGEPSKNYRLKQLIDEINKKTKIKNIYVYDDIMKAKEKIKNKILYHKFDSHWNQIGAYIGAYAFLKQFDIDIPDIHSDQISINQIKGNRADLAFMAGLNNLLEEDIDYEIHYATESETKVVYDKNGEIVCYKTDKPKINKKILFISDSFAEMLREYIAREFDETYFVSYLNFEPKIIKEYNPDIVVFETLERTSGNRLKFFGIPSLD